MRMQACGLAAILILGSSVSGCAANVGAVAGNVVGGAAWGLMKGGQLAWKGGTVAAQATGKAAVGAAKDVHDKLSPQDASAAASGASGEDASLVNQAKDVGPVASAQGQGAALAD
jgi:hypothetical protein